MAPSGRILVVAAVAVIAVLVGYAIYESDAGPGAFTSQPPSRFTVNGKTFVFTYIATTQPERQEGLMNRKVTATTTMLFAFPYPSQWAFWMYDTNTSLDMIWVNAAGSSGRVVYLVAGAQPCFNTLGYGCPTYTPNEPANYAIEAKAGFAAANDIAIGTSVLFG